MSDNYLLKDLECTNDNYVFILGILNKRNILTIMNDDNYKFIMWFIKKKYIKTEFMFVIRIPDRFNIGQIINDNEEVSIVIHDIAYTIFGIRNIYIKCSWNKFINDTIHKNLCMIISNPLNSYNVFEFDFVNYEGNIKLMTNDIVIKNLKCNKLDIDVEVDVLNKFKIINSKINHLKCYEHNTVTFFDHPMQKLTIGHYNTALLTHPQFKQLNQLKIKYPISKSNFIKIYEQDIPKLKLTIDTDVLDEQIFDIINNSQSECCIKCTTIDNNLMKKILELNNTKKIIISNIPQNTYNNFVKQYGYDIIHKYIEPKTSLLSIPKDKKNYSTTLVDRHLFTSEY